MFPRSSFPKWAGRSGRRNSKRRRSTLGLSPFHRRLACEALEVRTLLSVGLAAVAAGDGAQAGSAAQQQTLADLPAAAEQAISRAIGQDQSAYHVASAPAGATLANPANGFTAQVQSGVLNVSAGSDTWDMSLVGLGYGGGVRPVGTAETSASGNRVDCNYGAVDEWYLNGPGGLEQGFTIDVAPGAATGSASALLTVELALGGDLTGTVNAAGDGLTLSRPDGSAALGYTGLTAYDATGKALPASMELRTEGGRQDLLIRVDAAGAQGPITIDPFVQGAKLTASDGAAYDYFGYSVSISGNTVVVGAPYAMVGGNVSQGAAYVFTEPGSGWLNITQTAKLTASDGARGNEFGCSVSISGNAVVVTGGGTAYVFSEPGSGWANMTQTAKLTASDGGGFDSVSISGNTVVVGAEYATVGGNSQQGAAYVFAEPGSGWANMTQTAKLTASDGADGDWFGDSVSISGDTVVVGAPEVNGAQGAAYVFTGSGSAWTQTAKLTASDGAEGYYFGCSVSISGNTVTVGARCAKVGGSAGEGAAYVFTEPGSSWADTTQTAKLTASDGAAGFGSSVSVTGNMVVVGDNSNSAYVFTEPGPGWADTTQIAKFTAPDGAGGFGSSVSISGNTLVVGAGAATLAGNSAQGAAYVFGTGVAPAPAVSAVSPTSGPLPGGTSVTITGTNLANAIAVDFGSTPGSITSDTATQIVATSPAGAAGTVDVAAVTAGGTSTNSPADQFTYVAVPVVTVVTPTWGPTTGGTWVTITGTNLANATAVDFGGTPAAITGDTSTLIVAGSPAGTAGTVDVTVVTVGGTSATSSADRFTYAPAVVWTGAGTTDNWSDAANWDTDAVPGPTDGVIFDGGSVKESHIDAGFGGTVTCITIDGYVGTITQERSLTITGDYIQSSGTFVSPPAFSFWVGQNFSIPTTRGIFFERLTGTGTSNDPYLIYDVYGLQGIGCNPGSTCRFKLNSNIDASATIRWNDGQGFLPIGGTTGNGTFAGRLDGGGHTISNLYIDDITAATSQTSVGLFGLIDCSVAGPDNTGALAGFNYGAISNCYSVGGNVSDSLPYDNYTSGVGGLVGRNNYGTVSNCCNTASVSGLEYVGGLVGWNYGAISNSYNAGSIGSASGYDIGGLAAVNYGTISSSYNAGSVSCYNMAGGLVAWNWEPISNCYNTGNVSSAGNINNDNSIGGLVGWNAGRPAVISNAYNSGSISGIAEYAGGLVGWNYWGAIANSYDVGTVASGGGIVGENYSSATYTGIIANCGWWTGACAWSGISPSSSTYNESSPSAFMNPSEGVYTKGTTTWDFTTIWNIYPNESYPFFLWQILPLSAGALTLPVASEGVAFGPTTVFHFSDADPNGTPGNYMATVETGDATLSSAADPAQVEIVANSGGGFDVQLSYTYSEELSNVTFSVQVSDSDGAAPVGASTSTFSVADAPLTAGTLTPPVAAEGAAFGPTGVFHFSDADPNGTPGDYVAAVETGDATLTSTADPAQVEIVADWGGGFDVQLCYTYSEELSNATFSVQVSDSGGAAPVGGSTSTFSVADAALTAGALTPPIATAGVGFSNATLFHFTDAAGSYADIADYTATITWGDGTTSTITATPSAAGQIVADGGGGFDVQGTYTYAQLLAGATFSVAVADAGGSGTSSSQSNFIVPDANFISSAGTLQAGSNFTSATPLMICGGGATVDTNGFDVTLDAPITAGSGAGGLSKTGAGTLTLTASNNYSGGTSVADGMLVAENGTAIPSGSLLSIGSGGSVVLGDPGASEPLAVAQAPGAGIQQAAVAAAEQAGTGPASLVVSGASVTPAGGAAGSPAVSDSVLVPAAAAVPTATVAPAAVDRVLATQPRFGGLGATAGLPSSAEGTVGQANRGTHHSTTDGAPCLMPSAWPSALLPISPVPHSDVAAADHAGGRPAGDTGPRVAVLRTAASGQASDEVLLRIMEARAGNAAARAGNQHPATALFGLDLQTLDLLAGASAKACGKIF
jgi:autotransporter-associated beta strand protein